MQREVDEFRDIVDGEWAGGNISGKRPSADELTRAIQVMMTRQCIYSHTPGLGRAYDIVRGYQPFFERFFGTMGYRLTVSPRDQMVALSVPQGEARYDAVYERLRKDETLVLLGLRLLWEQGVREHSVGEAGVVEVTTGDLVDRIAAVTQTQPPEEARLLDILRMFQRHGAVRIGNRDRIERVATMSILPGVTVLVPDTYVEDLLLWSAAPAAQQGDGEPTAPEEEPEAA